MIRKGKLFVKPKKKFQKERILEENALLAKYALKNKKEVYKTSSKINYFRTRAKSLVDSNPEEQELFLSKLRSIGLNTITITDVLALKIEDLLERRLPTIVHKKGLSTTPRQARQMVVHKKVLVEGSVVNSPGYIVSVKIEDKITIKKKKKPSPKKEDSIEVKDKKEEKSVESKEAPLEKSKSEELKNE
jgi:small subunit ribosomal protein S4